MKTSETVFKNIDDVQIYLLKRLFSSGQFVTTRELKTLELCNVNISLLNPRNRKTFNPNRKWNLALAIGEFAWHLSGSNSLDFIAYYARQWKDFSSDGKLISQSCYGHKIFGKDSSGDSQWLRLVRLLKKDKFSRRAVLDLYNSDSGIDYFAKDIACVCTVQFLIRNERLDAIVSMRSNDLIWGLPYDIYLLTMLQELLSIELNIELGCYYHNVGSMHIYERHFSLGKSMLEAPNFKIEDALKMDNMEAVPQFLEHEESIRKNDLDKEEIASLPISQYWKELLLHLLQYKQLKIQKLKGEFK